MPVEVLVRRFVENNYVKWSSVLVKTIICLVNVRDARLVLILS